MESAVDNATILVSEEIPALQTPAKLISLDKFCLYIQKIIFTLIDEENLENDLAHQTINANVQKALDDKDNLEKIKKFAFDPQTSSLLIQKVYNKDEEELGDGRGDASLPEDNEFNENFSLVFANEIHYTGERVTSIGLIKKGTVLEADKKLSHQVRQINLSDDSPYETLRAYVSEAVAPYFKSYVRHSYVNEREGDKMAPLAEKKIAELEMALLHLQQNIDIPEITLPVHGHVSHVIARCRAEGRRPKMADFDDRINHDPAFLNSLHNQVNRWIREIQKVTKLDRDPSSGSALQEITFWLNMEHALLKIQEMRDSLEVTLSLDILKQGKRFHATVSFDTDTGLKQAIDMVTNYNHLMKDFPINELLSASTPDQITRALNLIFAHMRKVRSTRYPLSRTLRLLEALSRDLSAQLKKVLSHKTNLLALPYEEFERTMLSASYVFSTWDDQYEKLINLIREMNKKKTDPYKLTMRVILVHKKLSHRLATLEKFRKQHEQLRVVISSVLRQTSTQTNNQHQQQPPDTAQPLAEPEPGFAEITDVSAIKEINSAFEGLKEAITDPLDVGKEGIDAWDLAIKKYEERIDRVEARITAQLRDQLGTAKNAKEMFKIFSRYNALFIRPRIRGAIREYQTQLIQHVKKDIEALKDKFKVPYSQTSACKVTQVRDIPPVSGHILWVRQIERRLDTYMKRVEDILGKDWENHLEGRALKTEGDAFRLQLLNSDILFEEWAARVQARNYNVSGRIFSIESVRVELSTINRLESNPLSDTLAQSPAGAGAGFRYKLRVNFLPEMINLAKEVRLLKSLGYRISVPITTNANKVSQVYHLAIVLIENVKAYEQTCSKICDQPSLELLAAKLRLDVQTKIYEGIGLSWEHFKLATYVSQFSDNVIFFQEKVEETIQIQNKIQQDLTALETCPYTHGSFAEKITSIQAAVDNLSLKQFANLPCWISWLDKEIESRLAHRLQEGVKAWVARLEAETRASETANGDQTTGLGKASQNTMRSHLGSEEMDDIISGARRAERDTPELTKTPLATIKLGGDPKIIPLVHEFRISNQVIYLNPPFEEAREKLLAQFFSWMAVILSLPRVRSSRYSYERLSTDLLRLASDNSYQDLLSNLAEGPSILETAYKMQNRVISEAQEYVTRWFNYQSLWDLQPDMVYSKLGDDLSKWIDCLIDIRRTRATFDTSDTCKRFGPIQIEFGKVQSKVTLKYDSWHKEVLGKFGQLIGNEMQSYHGTISKARGELEIKNLDSASTSEAVTFITYVQSLKANHRNWKKQVEVFKEGQIVLEKHRYQFPNTWMYIENVEAEWNAFNEIMERKATSIQNQVTHLQGKILAEDTVVENKSTELTNEWETCKPVEGSLAPDTALKTLNHMEAKFHMLLEEKKNIAKAKEALGLSDTDILAPSGKDRTQLSLEELQDLKGVWLEISKVWEEIETLKDTPWASVQPRKVRQSLDTLLATLKSLPIHLRQYAAYEHVKKLIQGYTRSNVLIIELKSDAIKDRHWKQLARKLNRLNQQGGGASKSFSSTGTGGPLDFLPLTGSLNLVNFTADLTLGKVWGLDLVKHEKDIREVIMVAQGEMALEQFLIQLRETWQNYELDLVNYQNKCRLIRGWDDLFNKLKEHINSLAAMKLSPYFKEFEEDALSWEDKLNRANALFDIWIDVQRRWVYLEAIFTGSGDIKHLLPTETSRFQSISSEFLNLLKRVSKSPLVIDVLNIPGVQRSLERLSDFLTKIQKALGEYLERKRSSFPRFYFIGDEDLLEIIGNSRSLPKLQKHFKKMFAGVASLLYETIDPAAEEHTQSEDDGGPSSEKCIVKITGLCSKEGENVEFQTPVALDQNLAGKVNEWLALVEREMRQTLSYLLSQSVGQSKEQGLFFDNQTANFQPSLFIEWIDKYQAQIIVLTLQVAWTDAVETVFALSNTSKVSKNKNLATQVTSLGDILNVIERTLALLADCVLQDQPNLRRKKMEQLITELVHQRDVTRELIGKSIASSDSFDWLAQIRFYFNQQQPLEQSSTAETLTVKIANARFSYGWEYLGVQDKLVQTPLTDRCYLAMTQALEARLGGSPFGPAGTGKTESVKALGHLLGRFVLVFNCDETFDFQAMGRIFVGLCQVGAWGCFDEFNRLEERILSAISQQIQSIQLALKEYVNRKDENTGSSNPVSVELVGKNVTVNPNMAIFITMNPGYAGRSNLPDNLKKLFRSLAMTKPDVQLISQVMLFSQGFRQAEPLARKIVPLFKLCAEQLSPQSHYDFGLRALKSVLVSAGNIKRARVRSVEPKSLPSLTSKLQLSEGVEEKEILIQSICETVVPKLIAEDIALLYNLLADVFPGSTYKPVHASALRAEIAKVCEENFLVYQPEQGRGGIDESIALIGQNTDFNATKAGTWADKVIQLYQITQLHHGLMLVGPSGSGKSTAWKTLFKALERLEGTSGSEGSVHVIDPKAVSKEALYGSLDPNTREWTDGLFTSILRKIIDNVRGEINRRQWIIFDGDVDPEWVENLNSVLDDNKLLTLPNGERLNLPPKVRIIFEVQDLKYATMATVSRCGMVWFSEDVLTTDMVARNYLNRLAALPLITSANSTVGLTGRGSGSDEILVQANMGPTGSWSDEDITQVAKQVQVDVARILTLYFAPAGLVIKALEYAASLEHIMDFTRLRALGSLFSLLNQGIRNIINYQLTHPDFPMDIDGVERFIQGHLVYSILWSFAGDSKLKSRLALGDYIQGITTIALPSTNLPIVDYELSIIGQWVPWQNKVPQIEVETHKVGSPEVVVPTVDTVRHESLLYTWLAEHKPLVLCGPPGSGKTMTLFSALRALPDMEVVGLNFSSATTPELLLKTLDHYCEYKKTTNGLVLAPVQYGKWLVLFCDEINLPDLDKYGTQRVISFLRQIMEHGGFYKTTTNGEHTWVKMERIQFVGACNPPTDPGRKALSHRFLRHVPVIYVDYPGETSLMQIYGTFNRAMMRLVSSLRSYAEPLTNAMVEFYLAFQDRFTQDMQPHYIFSPRELTRWVRGIYEAIKPLDSLTLDGLVRLWAHEGLRLFQDRLVREDEKLWTDESINNVAFKHFPAISREALARPILYSNWLSKYYLPVKLDELREYTRARLKIFYEEELDVPLVLFDEVLDHVLRIDRIFRQQQGHLLLIGVSGSGKTTLSRFVAWMNGLSIFQIKVHNKYSAQDFDEDLRNVLRRAGCKGEKISFIMDESNVMDASFLERINTLLANGEVPGLFEGDLYSALMTQCKEGSQREGLMLDSNEELYKWFTMQCMRNLHVVFTMNPSSQGLKERSATSPALFNRCVINWFGDWSDLALFQVGRELIAKLDLDDVEFSAPADFPHSLANSPLKDTVLTYRDALVNAFVFVHQTLHKANSKLIRRQGRGIHITPRHYLDFINHYVKIFHEKRSELEDEQLHLNVGLHKIKDTVEQVEELQKSLALKRQELEAKNALANAKLKEMIKDQQEAEMKKTTSQDIQIKLNEQEIKIQEKKDMAMKELAQVEPAVIEAQQAVKGIKKQPLVEVRSMANPPILVKTAMESICLLLGENYSDWKAIRGVLMKDNFIPTILNFSTEDISDAARTKFITNYLSNPDYNYEKVARASQACGPLVKWAIAQINYADMLKKVEPLRNELKKLEQSAQENRTKARDIDVTIQNLEKSIANYKEEYALLISQAQTIKHELETVQTKVDRSVALLHSLGTERERWEAGTHTFRSQLATLPGDACLASAFLAYAGYFDQCGRSSLRASWRAHLERSGLRFRADLSFTEYLSSPDERVRWLDKSGLPSDDLCLENAVALKRSTTRYPLIIDPSGRAVEYVLKEYGLRKITKTSFLDDAFRKNLESALRFGNPLLVQDVENYDPILNPVLNRELRRTGGRVLVTLGDQDIDLSPAFTIFLSTRDPTVEFPPDLCSRVTLVNFTLTRSSLQAQCLNQVLKAERPDIDAKRSDLLKLQGEFKLRLRHLEKSLLQALNDAKGRSILEDDTVITTLETLKKEAGEVGKKMEETEAIMKEVESVSLRYQALANACSSIYFTMESLNQIHFLYQFSLQFFMDIFHTVLYTNPNLTDSMAKDPDTRLSIITKDLFKTTYVRVCRTMLHQDKIIFALLLARIYLKGFQPSEPSYDEEFDFLMRGKDSLVIATSDAELIPPVLRDTLSGSHLEALIKISKFPYFSTLPELLEINEYVLDWVLAKGEYSTANAKCVNLVQTIPAAVFAEGRAGPENTIIGQRVKSLILIQAFHPDKLIDAFAELVCTIFGGNEFLLGADKELNLGQIVEKEIDSKTPILFCSVQGYDASSRVDDLAAELGKALTSIAIGSSEGFVTAEKTINQSSKNGRWVVLKNVHLAPHWLIHLEKKLHTLSQPHPDFRLFLTMEINPKIPVNLIRVGAVFAFEPPPGLRANLTRTFATVIPATRAARPPVERARLYFLLAWFHALLQERLVYAPLGWSRRYEWNEADLRCALDTMDYWLNWAAVGSNTAPMRTNIAPDKIPWSAVRTLLSQCDYGGKVDNEFDQRLLSCLLEKTFNAHTFDDNYPLVNDLDGASGRTICMAEGTIRIEQFTNWITSTVPAHANPSWLGLPVDAEIVLRSRTGREIITKLLKVDRALALDDSDVSTQNQDDDSDKRVSPINTHSSITPGMAGAVPSWMRTLEETVARWSKLLQSVKKLPTLTRNAENISNPLFRFFEREIELGQKLLFDIKVDLSNVSDTCRGLLKMTNQMRALTDDLIKGNLPQAWNRYKGSTPDTSVNQWVADFSLRIGQLSRLAAEIYNSPTSKLYALVSSQPVWLGGLFSPEAYITATRQYAARSYGWPLEQLVMSVKIVDNATSSPICATSDHEQAACYFAISGLKLQGAKSVNNRLSLTSALCTDLPLTIISWEKMADEKYKGSLTIPVYLNQTRNDLLFTVDMEPNAGAESELFYERGVAFLCSPL